MQSSPPRAPLNPAELRRIVDAAVEVDARRMQASAQDATNATQPAGGAGQGGSDDISAAAAEAQAAEAQAASYR